MLNSQLPLITSSAIEPALSLEQDQLVTRKASLILRSARGGGRSLAPRPRLDDRTRQLGLDGVAAARAVLVEAARLRDQPSSLAA
jgi:hypothetical protein